MIPCTDPARILQITSFLAKTVIFLQNAVRRSSLLQSMTNYNKKIVKKQGKSATKTLFLNNDYFLRCKKPYRRYYNHSRRLFTAIKHLNNCTPSSCKKDLSARQTERSFIEIRSSRRSACPSAGCRWRSRRARRCQPCASPLPGRHPPRSRWPWLPQAA